MTDLRHDPRQDPRHDLRRDPRQDPRHDLRQKVWDRLRRVALPDSRLHFDFAHMHPDFEGSDAAAQRLMAVAPDPLKVALVAPDGALTLAREALLAAGVRLIVSTYRMRRGFRILDPQAIRPADYAFASTLDGLERFGTPVDLAGLAGLGRVHLVVTGAAAVAGNGVRFGRSYHYMDIEWGLLAELGLVGDATPIVVFVHDVQVVDEPITAMPREPVADFIVTPTRTLATDRRNRRATGVDWASIDPAELEDMPSLIELQKAHGLRR